MDDMEKSCPYRNSKSEHLVVQPVGSRYTGTKIAIYRTIVPSVLYGCETSSFISMEKLRRRVFLNRVLRGIFGGSRELHEELRCPQSSCCYVTMIKSWRTRCEENAA
jgi:hypothetical protein